MGFNSGFKGLKCKYFAFLIFRSNTTKNSTGMYYTSIPTLFRKPPAHLPPTLKSRIYHIVPKAFRLIVLTFPYSLLSAVVLQLF